MLTKTISDLIDLEKKRQAWYYREPTDLKQAILQKEDMFVDLELQESALRKANQIILEQADKIDQLERELAKHTHTMPTSNGLGTIRIN